MGLTRPRAYQIFDIDYKQAVRVITLSNITLTGNAPSQVDGVGLTVKDRVLVAGQSNPVQNGLYYVTTVGSGSNGTWQRSVDGDQSGEIESGMIVMVTEGTAQADTSWKLVTNDPITIGVTELVFEQNTGDAFGNINANGTSITANTASGIFNITAGEGIAISGNNVTKTMAISATGSATVAKILNGTSNVDITTPNGNITVGVNGTNNILVVGSSGANITGTLGISGNVTGNYFLGNGSQLTGIDATSIQSGTSNVRVISAGGNVATGIGGNGNIVVVASTGQFITGVNSVSGNITGGNLIINNNAVVTGNLTVNGTTTTINANTLNINDKDIVVANNVTGGTNIDGAGLLAGNPTTASFVYNNATTSWQSNIGVTPSTNGTLSLGGASNYWGTVFVTTVSATGNITSGNVSGTTGAFTNVSGNGSALTALNATNIASGTLAQARLANAAVTLGSTALALGATVTTIAGLSSVTSTTFVGALTGAATTAGTVTTAAQPNITSVGTMSTATITTLTTAGITKNGTNGVGNIGQSDNSFNTVFAKATSAQYADLAEMYVADNNYPSGTVIEFGGNQEVTVANTSHSTRVAGIVSTNPAYIMNNTLDVPFAVAVALTGRVPCRVVGMICKGDRLVASAVAGVATVLDKNLYEPGCIVGKALEIYNSDKVGVIEVAVGRF